MFHINTNFLTDHYKNNIFAQDKLHLSFISKKYFYPLLQRFSETSSLRCNNLKNIKLNKSAIYYYIYIIDL